MALSPATLATQQSPPPPRQPLRSNSAETAELPRPDHVLHESIRVISRQLPPLHPRRLKVVEVLIPLFHQLFPNEQGVAAEPVDLISPRSRHERQSVEGMAAEHENALHVTVPFREEEI
jgi:hypothetical protein